jgi:translation elongation factor EF-G
VFHDRSFFVAIAPRTDLDRERLAHGLRELMLEDPTFRIDSDLQTGRTVIDELQIERIVRSAEE